MICAVYSQLPDNTFLASVIVKRSGDEQVSNKIVPSLTLVLDWQRKEIGRQMHAILSKYVNQREQSLNATQASVLELECIFKLQVAVSNTRSSDMYGIARTIVFHEKNIWAVAPHGSSKFKSWIDTMKELIDFSKHLTNIKQLA